MSRDKHPWREGEVIEAVAVRLQVHKLDGVYALCVLAYAVSVLCMLRGGMRALSLCCDTHAVCSVDVCAVCTPCMSFVLCMRAE